jgi:hypothetical protein
VAQLIGRRVIGKVQANRGLAVTTIYDQEMEDTRSADIAVIDVRLAENGGLKFNFSGELEIDRDNLNVDLESLNQVENLNQRVTNLETGKTAIDFQRVWNKLQEQEEIIEEMKKYVFFLEDRKEK